MLTDFEQSVIAFFQDTADVLGAPRSLAAIYGILFASPKPLCFADIETKLGISKGSVSQGLKALKEIGAIKGTDHTGDRREWYEVDTELRKMVRRFLATRLETQLVDGAKQLSVIKSKITADTPDEAKVLTGRVEHLENWQGKAKALLPIIKAFLALGG